MTLNNVIRIAIIYHKGQKDKLGVDYIFHLLSVMAMLDNPTDDEMAAAVLHDIVEDTSATLEDLRNGGVTEDVIKLVDDLTKRKDESYFDYIERIKQNKRAVKIKIADIKHNLGRLTPEIAGLSKRYTKALLILEGG